MIYEEADKVQSAVMEHMLPKQAYIPLKYNNIPDIVHKIIDTDNIEIVLGDFGLRIQSFLKSIDLFHPDVPGIFTQIFSDDLTFYQDIKELILLADYAKEKNIKVLSKFSGKILRRSDIPKSVLDSIDHPYNNLHRIRLLKTRSDRDAARSRKQMQIVNLCLFSRKGNEIWGAQPDTLRGHARFNRPYEEEIKIAEEKALRYESLGCKELAQQIMNSVAEFKSQIQEMYYGFNRLTITNASVILAKFSGYKIITTWNDNFTGLKRFRIAIPKSVFGSHNFEIIPKDLADTYDYEPKVYPANVLWDIAPTRVKKIVDYLEDFPEANGKSIFDNYIVLVPSPYCSKISFDGKFGFRDELGYDVLFDTKELAMEALDRLLINKQYVLPILLGEKDGKCFFISYWK